MRWVTLVDPACATPTARSLPYVNIFAGHITSIGRAIAKGRADKKGPDGKSMTQKDLATKINEKPQVVSAFLRNRCLGVATR
jgi:hypothetical protein